MKKRHIHIDDMPEGYSCPLCPDHEDDEFVYCNALETHICGGCEWDIAFVLASGEKVNSLTGWGGPIVNEILTAKLEKLTGKSLEQLQEIYNQTQCVLDRAIRIEINETEE